MRVLAVTHGPDVGPELFGDVIAESGHELVEWDIRDRGRPPDAADAVIVLGGHENVGEEQLHPWLEDEYDAIRTWVSTDTPLLGVCLGAQALAHAFGGVVRPLAEPLGGFYVTKLTDAGVADPVLGALPATFECFNGNTRGFSVPDGATTLATGPGTQAFRVGERAWGVQFHPELKSSALRSWFDGDSALSDRVDDILRELDEKLPAWKPLGARLAQAFLRAASRDA